MHTHLQEESNVFWFAIRVKSNYEYSVATSIRGRGYESYLPIYPARRAGFGGLKTVQLPLFPGYVFGKFALNYRLPIVVIPGVLHIVGCGRIPAPVDPAELNAIKSVLASNLPAQPWPFLFAGDRVVLEAGPLRGLEGSVVAVKGCLRLVVSVTLLQRSVAVEIDRSWVRSIGRYPNSKAVLFQPNRPEALARYGRIEG